MAKVKAVEKAKAYVPVNHSALRFSPRELLDIGVSHSSVAPAPPTIVLNALRESAQRIREELAQVTAR